MKSVLYGIIISIHAPREGGDSDAHHHPPFVQQISIHAPREGGDNIKDCFRVINIISIHAPREGGDLFFS